MARSRTIHNEGVGRLSPGERALLERLQLPVLTDEDELDARPKTRGECGGGRPCPWAACRFHLAYDTTDAGSLKINFPDRELWQLAATCALDVADQGGQSHAKIARLMNLTANGQMWLYEQALAELQAKLLAAGIDLPAEDALQLLAAVSESEREARPASRAT